MTSPRPAFATAVALLTSTRSVTVDLSSAPFHLRPISLSPRSSTPSIHRVLRIAAPAGTSAVAFRRTVPSSESSTTYDYIIVGGGAAGCVVAHGLTDDPSIRVSLLEAGRSDDAFYIYVPLGFPYLLGSSRDWAFIKDPEPHIGNRHFYFPRSKVLVGPRHFRHALSSWTSR